MRRSTALGASLAFSAILALLAGCAKENNTSGSASQSGASASDSAYQAGQISFIATSTIHGASGAETERGIACANPAIIPSNSILRQTLAKVTPSFIQNPNAWIRSQGGVWQLTEITQFLLNAESLSSVVTRTKLKHPGLMQVEAEKAEVVCNGIYNNEDLTLESGAAVMIEAGDGSYLQTVESQFHFLTKQPFTHNLNLKNKSGSIMKRSEFVFVRQMRNYELYPGVFYSAETYVRSPTQIEIHAMIVWRELNLQQSMIYRFEYQAPAAPAQTGQPL